MSSEFAWISQLTERFRELSPARMHGADRCPNTVGIGDDAAIVEGSEDLLLCTVDAAVEKVHFRRDWMTLAQIAARATNAALSDIAAMGGVVDHPAAGVLFSLEIHSGFSDQDFAGLIDGLAQTCLSHRVAILGGNLSRNPVLSLSTTVLGRAKGNCVLRSGAQPGDSVFVTGTIGGSALGLKALLHKRHEEPLMQPFVQRFVAPVARLDVSVAMGRVATSCIDISDGLLQDAGHVSRASEVAIVLESERVPLLPQSDAVAQELGLDLIQVTFTGGEDYELLFTSPEKSLPFATRVGVVEQGQGVWLSTDAKRVRMDVPGAISGWDHFRSRNSDS